jgi:hypothetical protein
LARRVLTRRLGSLGLLVGFALSSCGRRTPAPAQAAASASAASAASSFVADTREQHLKKELGRARERWRSKPDLGNCASVLHEQADLLLCQDAAAALLAIEKDPNPTPENALPVLSAGALALARLSQRVRYLAIAELSDKHLSGDAGVLPVAPASSPPAHPKPILPHGPHDGEHAFQLEDSPTTVLMGSAVHLERDVVRNLGAYLEYGELPVRRSAFNAVKRLRNEHPQWPLLDGVLREAALLESDPELKRQLREFAATGLPRRVHPDQSPDSK